MSYYELQSEQSEYTMNYSIFIAFVNIVSQPKKEQASPEDNSQLLPQKYSEQELLTFCYLQKQVTFQA